MKALILAAAGDLNVAPLDGYIAKAMLPVVNRPLLELVLDHVRSYCFRDIIISTSHLAPQVEDYFRDGHRFNVQIAYSFEGHQVNGATIASTEGTAGAVRKIHEHSGFVDETLLIMPGDELNLVDLNDFYSQHKSNGALLSLVVKRVSNEEARPECCVRLNRWGQLQACGAQAWCPTTKTQLVNTGIYLLEPQILNWIPASGFADINDDVLPALMEAGVRVTGSDAPFQSFQIHGLRDYHRLSMMCLLGFMPFDLRFSKQINGHIRIGSHVRMQADRVTCTGQVFVGSGCAVADKAQLHGPLIIGSGSVIEQGAFLENSILLDHTLISEGLHVRNKIIGPGFCFDINGSLLDQRHSDIAWLFRDAREKGFNPDPTQRQILHQTSGIKLPLFV
ncbi:sugar phosphate nucleotidyltransferase [Undibacterium squillarum]|uniref:Mannose-1-phosphate guanyltransferase n=1 Tax=Undibacterium squillarum TaxID=1131567 RepID=A0ABQ2XWP2_9BURK|nr:NDP-sugar synthase [Undibacterium squillarum]GGX36556.1 mannose-1-phosphate guanyltransferase [Undibacterium squillarum]